MGGFLLYNTLPTINITIDLFILAHNFLIEQWNQGTMGRSALAFDVGCAVVAVYALVRRPEAVPA